MWLSAGDQLPFDSFGKVWSTDYISGYVPSWAMGNRLLLMPVTYWLRFEGYTEWIKEAVAFCTRWFSIEEESYKLSPASTEQPGLGCASWERGFWWGLNSTHFPDNPFPDDHYLFCVPQSYPTYIYIYLSLVLPTKFYIRLVMPLPSTVRKLHEKICFQSHVPEFNKCCFFGEIQLFSFSFFLPGIPNS